MRVATHHLPGLAEVPVRRTARVGDVELEHATLTPAHLGAACAALLGTRAAAVARRPVAEIIQALARVGDVWRRSGSAWAAEARQALPFTTGLSGAMIAETLPGVFATLTAADLEAFVAAEIGDPRALDGFVASPWGMRRATGPRLVAYVGAGNVPGLAVPAVVSALLAKAAVFVKASSGDPVLPALFARSLASVDAELGACVAAAWWPGGTRALDETLLSRADVVIVEGEDRTVDTVRRRARGRVLGFGHRLSLAAIAREATADLAAVVSALARDVSLYDQHGCLSPQVVYVEAGGDRDALAVAQALGTALVRLEEALPRGRLVPEDVAALRSFRDEGEWRALGGEGVRVFGSPEAAGVTVVYEPTPDFAPTCANRTVRLKPLRSLAEIPDRLGAWAQHIEAIGVAATPARLRELATLLAQTSTASRVCPLGRMQEPAAGWRRGGVPRLGTLVRWLDIEDPQPQRFPAHADSAEPPMPAARSPA
jgi:hypothetical protein